jgi:hypothetical protein
VGIPPSLLSDRRAAFAAVGACVVTWFVVAPHLPRVGLWWSIAIVAAAVMPATLALILVALPLWPSRVLLPAAVVLALVAFGCTALGWGLAANFAKLWAAVFAGWAFLWLFEQLSWVVLVALVIPAVDAISVWHGPTKAITAHHFEVYTAVAIAFLVPGGGAAYLGPPDVLFYALFLAAAARWRLRVLRTWLAMTFMYAFTLVLAYALDVGGLPALPFLSFGFFVANGDLLWRSIRPSAGSSSETASSAGDGPAPS